MRPSLRLFESAKKAVQKLMTMRKPVTIDLKDCKFQAVRGSGPGGQAVAKTNNMAILTHKPSGIVIKNHETRSLEQNKEKAVASLKAKLDNMINGECSLEALKAVQERAKKQVRAIKAKKKQEKPIEST